MPTATTRDGLEIAADPPTGCTVVVRRPGPARDDHPGGEDEFLVLHRNSDGPEYEGDWAWTSPAGCRQPGEPVYPAALRELEEEAGLRGYRPWLLDADPEPAVGGQWATFGLDVAADVEIELIDPEHDRHEWLPAAEALDRVKPDWVGANQVGRMARTRRADIGFRSLTHDDLPQVREWRLAPHARRWWALGGCTLAELQDRYGPRIDGETAVRMWVVQADGADVGLVQDAPVGTDADLVAGSGAPDAVAIDYLLGVEALTGHGLGTKVIWQYLRDLVVPAHPDAPHAIANPDHHNPASLRALAKCGFSRGPKIDVPAAPGSAATTQIVCSIDLRHWFGVPG